MADELECLSLEANFATRVKCPHTGDAGGRRQTAAHTAAYCAGD